MSFLNWAGYTKHYEILKKVKTNKILREKIAWFIYNDKVEEAVNLISDSYDHQMFESLDILTDFQSYFVPNQIKTMAINIEKNNPEFLL